MIDESTNRILYVADNLRVLRGIESESIDLIATDPPFNSKRSFNAPLGSRAARQKFDDRWCWDEVTDEWHDVIAADHPAIKELIEAAVTIEGGKVDAKTGAINTGRIENSIAAYIAWMAPRVVEMHRILKPSGSIYLHCDSTASHYLKLLMDGVFGGANYRNEIVWKRTTSHNDPQRFGKITDSILYYGASQAATFHVHHSAHDERYARTKYRIKTKWGLARSGDLTGPRVSTGESGVEWKGWNPTDIGRCWSVPMKGTLAKWIAQNAIPGYENMTGIVERLDALDDAGLIDWSSKGTPNILRPLASTPGRPLQNLWSDIPPVNSQANERTGWATQKPLALYRRMIEASSNEGDLVLDPFCGCATTCVAAEQLQRRWIGIDIDPEAENVTKNRLREETGIFEIDGNPVTIRKNPPRRTDIPNVPDDKLRVALWNNQARKCANPYCDSGELRTVDLHLDHRIPKARGGEDGMLNRIGLCQNCNGKKGVKAWGTFLDGERAKQPHPTLHQG